MVLSIPSPPSNGIDLGPLQIRFYGLFYVIAVIAAVAITTRRWEREGGSRELVHEVVLWAFPAGLVGARLYYVITSWGEVPKEWWGPLAVWRGGLGVWGGIAMGTLVGVLVLRRRGADVARFMDAAAPALLVARGDRGGSATTSTRNCSAARRPCRGGSRSTRRAGQTSTPRSRRFTRRSSKN